MMSKDNRQKTKTKSRAEEWYNLTLAEVVQKIGTPETGLKQKEVEERLRKYGTNTLPPEKKTGAVILFLRQFKNSFTYILLAAAAVSFYLDDIIDAYVILAAVAFNVIVGFIQEYKAQSALASLKKIITQKARVIRDGREREINAQDLVPGDLVILSSGDKVPADGRLLEAEHLKVKEAALTGEAEPAAKTNNALAGKLTLALRRNLVFFGTVVTEGRGKFIVTGTGNNTEIGRIALLVRETKETRTPLQLKLDSFSRRLGLVVLGAAVFLLAFGIAYNQSFVEMFTTAVAVAVSAIPEGLIVGVTIILAVGMQRILKKGSLVRQLVAAETLGSTTVICADKTGTVTLGEMRVARFFTASHQHAEINGHNDPKISEQGQWELKRLNQIGFFCSNAVLASAEVEEKTKKEELLAEKIIGAPTEQALLYCAIEYLDAEKEAERPRPRLDEVQFDSAKKFMATMHSWQNGRNIIFLKGAPEKVLQFCARFQVGRTTQALSAQKREEFLKSFAKLSGEGLRVLAGAYKLEKSEFSSFSTLGDYQQGLIFVGFWGIKDPLRPEAEESIKTVYQAGARTVMITGDNKHTALAIAKELGLNPKADEIIDGAELADFSQTQLERAVKKVKVFSRTTPLDKLRIVEALQKNGEVVAMTGDGVNDAPALQKADIGVALGSGTDVARETADLVLLDNNFATIVAAVREGRVIFDNIRKVTLYLLANSFSELTVVVIGLLLGWPLPLLAAQILWINLVTDGFPDLALTQEPGEREVMNEPPVPRNEPVLDFERKFLIFFVSIFTAGVTLGLFYLIWQTSGDVDRARTVAFTAIGVGSLLYVFSVRSLRRSILDTKIFANRWLLAAVAGGLTIQIIGIYLPFFQKFLRSVPLPLSDWILIIVACLWTIFLVEIAKHFFIVHRLNHHHHPSAQRLI